MNRVLRPGKAPFPAATASDTRVNSLAFRAGNWTLVAALAAELLLGIGYEIGSDRRNQVELQIASPEVASVKSAEAIKPGCALLSRILDARIAGDVEFKEGDSLPPENFILISGAVRIDFFSGATMLMDESAELRLVSAWEAECVRVKVTMQVPPSPIGFRLLLPGMEVVDLGTEFAVEVDGRES